MTCKDCINEDYCKSMCSVYYDHLSQECEMFCRNKICEHRYDNADKNCKGFKDKSKIIELPCKVGDTVNYISGIGIKNYLVKSAIVNEIIINCDGMSGLSVSADYCDFENSFDTFFLTREEAEAKLKELNGQ